MKKISIYGGIAALLVSGYASASNLNVTNDFVSGTTASAAAVNQNFTDVETAVNDNDGRITTNTTSISGLNTSVANNATNIANNATSLAGLSGCPADMVTVGSFCIDRYEASVYNAASGGSQIANVAPVMTACLNDGSNCHNTIFARSVSGVVPASNVTWFQAAMACANVGKRLPTNAEWTVAAIGTNQTDGGGASACNTTGSVLRNTGVSGLNCQSAWGAQDMAGNVREWVADWIQGNASTDAGNDGTMVSDTLTTGSDWGSDTVAGVSAAHEQNINLDSFTSSVHLPAAVYRGGGADSGNGAGIYFFAANAAPSYARDFFGFRCAKSL